MNLSNLKVVELNAQETKRTEGGIAPLLIYAGYAACVAIFGAGVYVGYRNAEASNK